MQKIKEKIIKFLKNEVNQRGFQKVVFGLSGGIDSAVVGCLCSEAFKNQARAILMPSLKSSQENFEDAKMLAEILKIPHEIIPLEPYERIFEKYGGIDRVRYGNLCARIRMMLLYDFSQRDGALVIGTSNKTERILGYGTIYGDLACAINPIGDLLKSDVFELAKELGIPSKIISKKPSADLYEGQSDEEEFGYSYGEIDVFLKDSKMDVSGDLSEIKKWAEEKYPQDFLDWIFKRIEKNRFKNEKVKIFNNVI